MTSLFFPNDPQGVFHSIGVPGFGLSWVGLHPFGEGYCLGSETGTIVFTDATGKRGNGIKRASLAEQAINGIGWSDRWLIVTTRSDINLIGPWGPNGPEDDHASIIEGGAHGVTVAPSGHFVLPLGRGGIMFIKPSTGSHDPVAVTTAREVSANIYATIALGCADGTDLIVCATRSGGVGFTSFAPAVMRQKLWTARFPGLDVVDVCSMATEAFPRAVAAVGRDGSLILFNDILTDRHPQTLKFRSVTGTAYRVMSAQGNIFLLTSAALYGLMAVAESFLEHTSVSIFDIEILAIPIEAADAHIADDRWLLAVGIDEILRFDLHQMPRSKNDGKTGGKRESPENLSLSPAWEESDYERAPFAMAK
jgi:hypothetical protein